MKKFKMARILAIALSAAFVVGSVSMSTKADDDDMAAVAGYSIEDESLDAEVNALVDEASEFANVEVVDPAKSTFVAFVNPAKVVEYDGKPHGLYANVFTTVTKDYVASAKLLYIGATEDGTIYRSFEKPVEPGYYHVVAMYYGSEDYYPSVAYGVIVILPEKESEPEVTPTPDVTPEVTPTPDVTPEVTPAPTETPVEDETPEVTPAPTETPVEDETSDDNGHEIPKTADATNVIAYVVVMLSAVAVMVASVFARKRA